MTSFETSPSQKLLNIKASKLVVGIGECADTKRLKKDPYKREKPIDNPKNYTRTALIESLKCIPFNTNPHMEKTIPPISVKAASHSIYRQWR